MQGGDGHREPKSNRLNDKYEKKRAFQKQLRPFIVIKTVQTDGTNVDQIDRVQTTFQMRIIT